MEITVAERPPGACALLLRALRMITPAFENISEANYRIRLERAIGEPERVAIQIWRGNCRFNWQSGTWDFPEAMADMPRGAGTER